MLRTPFQGRCSNALKKSYTVLKFTLLLIMKIFRQLLPAYRFASGRKIFLYQLMSLKGANNQLVGLFQEPCFTSLFTPVCLKLTLLTTRGYSNLPLSGA
jgi:hypothetical protein